MNMLVSDTFGGLHTVYLDAQATERPRGEAIAVYVNVVQEHFGNALGRDAKQALETARETIAAALNAPSNGVFLTSSATEGNNLIIDSAALRNRALAVSAIEHKSVLEPARHCAAKGTKLTTIAEF